MKGMGTKGRERERKRTRCDSLERSVMTALSSLLPQPSKRGPESKWRCCCCWPDHLWKKGTQARSSTRALEKWSPSPSPSPRQALLLSVTALFRTSVTVLYCSPLRPFLFYLLVRREFSSNADVGSSRLS